MSNQQLHLYSFLRHLVKENYAKAENALKHVVEHKIRLRARNTKVRMYSEKRIASKMKPKVKAQKETKVK